MIRECLEADALYSEALVRGDYQAMAEFVTPDFVYIDISGNRMTPELMRARRSADNRVVVSNEVVDEEIVALSDRVVVIRSHGRSVSHYYGGLPRQSESRSTTVWPKCDDDQWRMTSAQSNIVMRPAFPMKIRHDPPAAQLQKFAGAYRLQHEPALLFIIRAGNDALYAEIPEQLKDIAFYAEGATGFFATERPFELRFNEDRSAFTLVTWGNETRGVRLEQSSTPRFTAPSEFEPQQYIWMTWIETGWLGGPPMSDTMIELIKVISPHVKVRLLYSEWTCWTEQVASPEPPRTLQEAHDRLIGILTDAGIDPGRVELMPAPFLFGALQDPGPFFLRSPSGSLAIADFNARHPIPIVETLDRVFADRLGLPTVRSEVISDGGNRQSNGRGTLMLGEVFARHMNPTMTRDEIEREHLRVHGAEKLIWLQHGPREEDFGPLDNGRWGIGTGGHVDQFARFADERTILLMQVLDEDRERDPILAETHRRMEENFAILSAATDQDGRLFRIIRVPAAELMTFTVSYDDLSNIERSWFVGAQPGDVLTFYLPGSYLNFVIANDVVVTAKYWRKGMPDSVRHKDQLAALALEQAFPGRKVVQIDVTPLLHDGAGLHCYTRNQPFAQVQQ